jgi:hypothetical protein
MFMVNLLLFEIGSAICGAAPNLPALIVGRVIAGVGGCGIYAGGLMYVSLLTTNHERPLYLAGIYSIWGIGYVLGPVVRGSFWQSAATWRWGFYVNARDAAGNVSQASSTVWVTPPFCSQDTTAPSVPAGLIGSAIGTAVTLRWATATDYSYTVTARDAQGNTSKPSEPARVRTEGSCAAVCGIAQVTTERDLPWGLLQLPDGTVLYGQRDLFTIQAMAPDGTNKHSIGKVPDAAAACGSARTANSMRPPVTVRIPTRRRISPVSAGRCCG